MSLPRLVSPPPDARMPTSHEDREAIAQLKLHLLMARLRTAFRVGMESDWGKKDLPHWDQYMCDELVCILQSQSCKYSDTPD